MRLVPCPENLPNAVWRQTITTANRLKPSLTTPDNMTPAKTASEKTPATSKVLMAVHHCHRLRLGRLVSAFK